MMKEYRSNGYIICIGDGAGGIEISDERVNAIYAAISAKPQAEEGIGYRLREDLTWEAFEVEPVPEPTYPSSDEALSILLGGDINV